jgi:hypothetical protein
VSRSASVAQPIDYILERWDRFADSSKMAGSASRTMQPSDVIAVPAGMRVLVATKPVDFRRGADRLAASAASGIRGYRAEFG